jgi:proteasome accessory factor A
METEYALAVDASEGSQHSAAEALLALARHRLVHLPGASSAGLFLESGARFYNDIGSHPEFCTPEVDSPLQLVQYLAAGDVTVGDLVSELRAGGQFGPGPILLKSNICYAEPGTTWASHESYMHRARPDAMPKQLIPFLVSRVLFGSGGLNVLCPGIQFSMSPRCHTFLDTIGETTTGNRPIYNTRNESLATGGMYRLHVIVGDSTHSQRSQLVKIGATALVVALAEAGLDPGGAMRLACPLIALHSFATDPHFRTAADRPVGGPVTALDIQRHYLSCAEDHIDHPLMPPWAGEVCQRWREALDLAERGPFAATKIFDWAVKKSLFDRHIRRRGIDPETFGAWNHALTCVRNAHRDAARTWKFNESILFGSHPAVVAERQKQEGGLRMRGLRWDQAAEILALRAQLCEIDLRYAQISPSGLYAELEPHLRHRLLGESEVNEARVQAPNGTRAKFRGEQVRSHAGQRGCAAEWQGVWDDKGMFMDLGDPLVQDPQWKPVPVERTARPSPVTEAALLYEQGDYPAAYARASRILTRFNGATDLPSDDRRQLLRVLAWTRARTGELDAALAGLDILAVESNSPEPPLWLINDYIGVYRKSSLAPDGTRFWELIGQGERRLETRSPPREVRAQLLGHKGFALVRQGRIVEAINALRMSYADAASGPVRVRARSLADLADAHRRMGDTDMALQTLAQAEALHWRHGLANDLADHSLPVRAKLTPDRRTAYKLLCKAARTQSRSKSNVALARTLLLQARLVVRQCRCAKLRDDLARLRTDVPSLRQCPVLGKVLDHWQAWTHNDADPSAAQAGTANDPFWGV